MKSMISVGQAHILYSEIDIAREHFVFQSTMGLLVFIE